MLCNVVVVIRTHPRVILPREKRFTGFCEYGAPLGGPSDRRSSAKISNVTVEILRIHENYVTTKMLTLMLQNCLLVLALSWWHQSLETDRRNVKRRTEILSEVFLHVFEERRT